jgi:hypothetical protein
MFTVHCESKTEILWRIKLMCQSWWAFPSLEVFLLLEKRGLNEIAILQCRHRGSWLWKTIAVGGTFVETKYCHHGFGKVSYLPWLTVLPKLAHVEWNGRLEIGRNRLQILVRRICTFHQFKKMQQVKLKIWRVFGKRFHCLQFSGSVFWYESSWRLILFFLEHSCGWFYQMLADIWILHYGTRIWYSLQSFFVFWVQPLLW